MVQVTKIPVDALSFSNKPLLDMLIWGSDSEDTTKVRGRETHHEWVEWIHDDGDGSTSFGVTRQGHWKYCYDPARVVKGMK